MAEQTALEAEIAVTRAGAVLKRAWFRAPSIITVGRNQMTTITVAVPDVPDFHEILYLTSSGAQLRFSADQKLSLTVAGQTRTGAELISSGAAESAAGTFGLALAPGHMVEVEFGPVQLTVRVAAESARQVFSVTLPPQGDPQCSHCGHHLKDYVWGGGALTLCGNCGTFNRLGRASTPRDQGDFGHTQLGMSTGLAIGQDDDVPAAGRPAGLPTFDAIGGANPPGAAGADLPTFDAISAFKEQKNLSTIAALGVLRGDEAPPRSAPEQLAPQGPAPTTAPTGEAPPPPSPSSSAASDLPTFDAISVFKQDENLSTVAAIQALRIETQGGDAFAEPSSTQTTQLTAEAPAEAEAPVWSAPATTSHALVEAEAAAPAPAAPATPPATPPAASPPAAPAVQARPAPRAPSQAEPVTTTKPDPGAAAEAAPAQSSGRGQWEETLTIGAYRPKRGGARGQWVKLGVAALLLVASVVILLLVLESF